MRRRDFIITGGAAAAGIALAPHGLRGLVRPSVGDAYNRDVAEAALDAATRAGASYADVRVSTNRSQNVSTREQLVTGLSDSETSGVGVRALVEGTWGFAASRILTNDSAEEVARKAVSQARANRAAQRRPVELASIGPSEEGEWRSPIEVDPFDVSIEDKVDLLLRANAAATQVRGARFASSSLSFIREEKFFASTDGIVTNQTVYRCWPRLSVSAVAADGSDFQSRDSTPLQPMGLGWEYVRDADLVGKAPIWAEEAVQKLSARSVEPGLWDLVLLPSHLFLTLHESIAHPTELDRIQGFEANYAGTSFIYPVEDYLGSFRYGPDFMNIQGERSAAGGLATVGWDDEGVRPEEYFIVKDGILNDLQTTREQAPWLADWYRSQGREVRSHGNSYAQSWADVQFQRMPNTNLMPNQERDVSLDELVSEVDKGIVIEGRGSYSIDQQRYNAQFGGQVFYEIKNGKIEGMLKDASYQIRTPEFWNSMDQIGGPSTYELGGTFGDGKGQPGQANAVSHGCPASRFRDVTVLNTARNG
ncbi:MAG: TldD/PmbA family protein [Gemmatimonadetes bacterium]|jgi:TldD protein|nr:TldD/PmbA family protein [Gemmatimonadota bacterium]